MSADHKAAMKYALLNRGNLALAYREKCAELEELRRLAKELTDWPSDFAAHIKALRDLLERTK